MNSTTVEYYSRHYPEECQRALNSILSKREHYNVQRARDLKLTILQHFLTGKYNTTMVHLFMSNASEEISVSDIIPGQVFVYVPYDVKNGFDCDYCAEAIKWREDVYWVVQYDKLCYNPSLQFNKKERLCTSCLEKRYVPHPNPQCRLTGEFFRYSSSHDGFDVAAMEWRFPFRGFRTWTGTIETVRSKNDVIFGWSIKELVIRGVWVPKPSCVKKACQ